MDKKMNNEEKMTVEKCVSLIKTLDAEFQEKEIKFWGDWLEEKVLPVEAYIWNEQDKIYMLKDRELILEKEKYFKFYFINRQNLTDILNRYYDRLDEELVKAEKLEEIINEYENMTFKELEKKIAEEIATIADSLYSLSCEIGYATTSNCVPEKYIEIYDNENRKREEMYTIALAKIDIYNKKCVELNK